MLLLASMENNYQYVRDKYFICEAAMYIARSKVKELFPRHAQFFAKNWKISPELYFHAGSHKSVPDEMTKEQLQTLTDAVKTEISKILGSNFDFSLRVGNLQYGSGKSAKHYKNILVNFPKREDISQFDIPMILERLKEKHGHEAIVDIVKNLTEAYVKILKEGTIILGSQILGATEIEKLCYDALETANLPISTLNTQTGGANFKEILLQYQARYECRRIYLHENKNFRDFKNSFNTIQQNLEKLGLDYSFLKNDTGNYPVINAEIEKEIKKRRNMSSDEIKTELESLYQEKLQQYRFGRQFEAKHLFNALVSASKQPYASFSDDGQEKAQLLFEHVLQRKEELKDLILDAGGDYAFLDSTGQKNSREMSEEIEKVCDLIIAKNKAFTLYSNCPPKNPDETIMEIRTLLSKHNLDFSAIAAEESTSHEKVEKELNKQCYKIKYGIDFDESRMLRGKS